MSYLIEDWRQIRSTLQPIAPRSPRQNGFAKRLIGSIRRECLDHLIVFDEEHLRQMLRELRQLL